MTAILNLSLERAARELAVNPTDALARLGTASDHFMHSGDPEDRITFLLVARVAQSLQAYLSGNVEGGKRELVRNIESIKKAVSRGQTPGGIDATACAFFDLVVCGLQCEESAHSLDGRGIVATANHFSGSYAAVKFSKNLAAIPGAVFHVALYEYHGALADFYLLLKAEKAVFAAKLPETLQTLDEKKARVLRAAAGQAPGLYAAAVRLRENQVRALIALARPRSRDFLPQLFAVASTLGLGIAAATAAAGCSWPSLPLLDAALGCGLLGALAHHALRYRPLIARVREILSARGAA